MRRCPSRFTQCIFVSCDAPTMTVFQGLAFLRGGSEEGPERVRGSLPLTNGVGAAVSDCIVAISSVVGTVGSDAADLLVRRNLVGQVG